MERSTKKDIKLDIQPFNYCAPSTLAPFNVKNGKTVTFFDYLDYHLIRKNHILITYYNATVINDIYTYKEWGMIIDLDGNVLDKIPFASVDVNRVLPDS